MPIRDRRIPGDKVRDPSDITLVQHNEPAGAQKNIEVGRALLPLPDGASGYTTNATTRKILPSAGRNLAIYNNSGGVLAVTVGDSTVTSQAAGAVQTSGANVFVGVPCAPNDWTYLACAEWNHVIASSALLLVFLIDDPTYIVTQPNT